MRILLLTAAVWLAGGVTDHCLAQINVRQYVSDRNADRLEWQEREAKRYKAGKEMFGTSPRYLDPSYHGPLKNKNPGAYALGDWGVPSEAAFRTLEQVSEQEYLVVATELNGRGEFSVFLLRGIDVSKAQDDRDFELAYPVLIDETYQYSTITGANKTILVLDAEPNKVDAKVAAIKQAAEDALYRQWSDATGQFKVEAKFLDVKNSQAVLHRRDTQADIEIPLSRLSTDDQKWIRDELKRHSQASKPKPTPKRRKR